MKFKKLIHLIGIISIGLVLSTTTASALTIFDNGTQLAGQGAGSDSDSRADNFSLASSPGLTIRSIHWRGRYSGGDNIAGDNFTLRIYSDNSGPDTQVHEFEVGNMVNRTDTGLNFVGADIFDYSANITATTLTASTTYWLSIFNNTSLDTGVTWVWIYASNLGTAGNNAFSSTNAGTSWSPFGPRIDFSFRLDDAAVSTVPVPAAVWLMGSALMGLVGFSRRKSTTA